MIDILKTRFLQRFFPRLVTSDALIRLLKSRGVKIGEGTFIFDAGRVTIDSSRPVLLDIGKYCKITGGVIILTHDYSRSVLRRVYGDVLAEARQTRIGDNVFIGVNSIILMGTIIGENCIIGAGSVLHGTFPANSVIAGNPAKVICSLEEYYLKRKENYIDEAKTYAKLLWKTYNHPPTIQDMGSFFPIYMQHTMKALKTNRIQTKLRGDNEEEILEAFINSVPVYANLEEFLQDAGISQ